MRAEVWMLHRVVPAKDRTAVLAWAPAIEPDALDAALERRRSWRKVPPARLLDPPGPGEPDRLLVTFDDGLRCFREHALPVLEQHGAHCALFVAVDFACGAEPYERELARILESAAALDLPGGERAECAEPEAKRVLFRRVRLDLKYQPAAARTDFVSELARANGMELPPPEPASALNWSEIIELDRHPLVTIGCHGGSHRPLRPLGLRDLWVELRAARLVLEWRLGHPIDTLAYPYGEHSARVRALARLAGFQLAFTTRPGHLDPARPGRRLALPRLDPAELAGPAGDG
jgi:peptidoglycan/xylan/chitin deacetylase (PgdA/CDA1 family)